MQPIRLRRCTHHRCWWKRKTASTHPCCRNFWNQTVLRFPEKYYSRSKEILWRLRDLRRLKRKIHRAACEAIKHIEGNIFGWQLRTYTRVYVANFFSRYFYQLAYTNVILEWDRLLKRSSSEEVKRFIEIFSFSFWSISKFSFWRFHNSRELLMRWHLTRYVSLFCTMFVIRNVILIRIHCRYMHLHRWIQIFEFNKN